MLIDIYGVMKRHGLLLQRHGGGAERRHDGRISVALPNLRWCSDGFEVARDNGEKVRIAFALDCCDREAMSFVATIGGIDGEEVRDLMLAAIEHRFGRIDRLPDTIEGLSEQRLGLRRPRDPQIRSRSRPRAKDHSGREPTIERHGRGLRAKIKRDYLRVSPRPNAETVVWQLPGRIAHYNEVHPRRALGYRLPREFLQARSIP